MNLVWSNLSGSVHSSGLRPITYGAYLRHDGQWDNTCTQMLLLTMNPPEAAYDIIVCSLSSVAVAAAAAVVVVIVVVVVAAAAAICRGL
jgi:hypothetical protein